MFVNGLGLLAMNLPGSRYPEAHIPRRDDVFKPLVVKGSVTCEVRCIVVEDIISEESNSPIIEFEGNARVGDIIGRPAPEGIAGAGPASAQADSTDVSEVPSEQHIDAIRKSDPILRLKRP